MQVEFVEHRGKFYKPITLECGAPPLSYKDQIPKLCSAKAQTLEATFTFFFNEWSYIHLNWRNEWVSQQKKEEKGMNEKIK